MKSSSATGCWTTTRYSRASLSSIRTSRACVSIWTRRGSTPSTLHVSAALRRKSARDSWRGAPRTGLRRRMRTSTLFDGGPSVSAVGLGCNSFGLSPFGQYTPYERCELVVEAALDEGYTFFDTADSYGKGESEEFLGRALGSRRDSVVVATKFGYPMPDAPAATHGTEEYVRWAIEGSLRRLGAEYVDLFQIHRPDEEVPIDETLG